MANVNVKIFVKVALEWVFFNKKIKQIKENDIKLIILVILIFFFFTKLALHLKKWHKIIEKDKK